MLRLIATLLLVVAGAAAAEERKFAVLSLIGDQMLITQYTPTTGGRLDRNPREYLQLDDPVLDKTALFTVSEALTRIDPAAKPVLLVGTDRSIYAMQAQLLDEGASMNRLLDKIRPLLAGTGATHLILLTKVREEARMRLYNDIVGSGMIEGVGFYIDPVRRMKLIQTGESATGFIAAFAYFQLGLIDLGRGEIVKEERVLGSKTTTVPNAKAADVWGAISAQNKMRMLQNLVRDETLAAVPRLLAAPK